MDFESVKRTRKWSIVFGFLLGQILGTEICCIFEKTIQLKSMFTDDLDTGLRKEYIRQCNIIWVKLIWLIELCVYGPQYGDFFIWVMFEKLMWMKNCGFELESDLYDY